MAAPVSPQHSAAGRAAAKKSPWSKGPFATTDKAKASYIQYQNRSKQQETRNASE